MRETRFPWTASIVLSCGALSLAAWVFSKGQHVKDLIFALGILIIGILLLIYRAVRSHDAPPVEPLTMSDLQSDPTVKPIADPAVEKLRSTIKRP